MFSVDKTFDAAPLSGVNMILLPGPEIDRIRARPMPDLAAAIDVVMSRAHWLLPDDRLIIELAIRNRVPHRQIAIALKVPAGTVSRRVRRILRRLNDPLSVALLDARCPLPADHREVGVEHFVQGLSASALAQKHDASAQHIRRMIMYVRGWHRGASSAASLRRE
jgi:DNA-directed RNA polymerase specialized sigma24 family protein